MICQTLRTVRARPRDPFGRRVYVAPLGLSVAVEGAVLSLFSLAADQRRLSLELTPHERAFLARLRLLGLLAGRDDTDAAPLRDQLATRLHAACARAGTR